MADIPAATDTAILAEITYHGQRPLGSGSPPMPPRDQVERLITAPPRRAGDYLTARFGGRESTHAMGDEGNPLGCALWHAACLYPIAWREALLSLADDLDEMAAMARPGTEVRGAVVQVAVLARQKAEAAP